MDCNSQKEGKSNILYNALRIRMVEEKIMELYPTDVIQSPVHLSIGQEIHIAALMSLIDRGDRTFTTYRSHAVYLASGGDLYLMFAELFGKCTGISKGKAGSMHLCHPSSGLMGSSAIVGAVFSHALGAAYANKIGKTNNIILCITGEGATEEGAFHECLNFASLKKLPIIYIIENNGLAINIPVAKRQSYNLKDLVSAYSIRYFHIANCFDIDEVSEKVSKAINIARKDGSPAVVEIETYRYKEHVGINCDHNENHRNIDEFEKWQLRDPLINCKEDLIFYRSKIEDEISSAVLFAQKSPYPSKNDLLEDVY